MAQPIRPCGSFERMMPTTTQTISARVPDALLVNGLVLLRLVVGGAVFVSEGVQKFLYPLELGSGRFEKIGIPFAHVMAPIVGATEVLCGLALLFGYRVRLVTVPLMLVMLGALISTKLPILLGNDVLGFTVRELPRYGVLAMLHEARTDLLSLVALLALWRHAGHRHADPYADPT